MNNKEKQQKSENDFILSISNAGYTQLEPYKGNKVKVMIKCDKGHEYMTKPEKFKSGDRCPACSGKCPIHAKKEFIELLSSLNYTLLEPNYKYNKDKVKMICDKGHNFSSSPDNMKSKGTRCPVCVGVCKSNAANQFNELLKDTGYQTKDKYTGAFGKICMVCDKGHKYETTPSFLKSGRRCPTCAKTGYDINNPGYFYLYEWSLGDSKFLKYGITSDLKRRLKEQKKVTDYKPKLISSIYSIDGRIPHDIEKLVKSRLISGFMEKEKFGDGHTETVEYSIDNINYIVNIQNSICSTKAQDA